MEIFERLEARLLLNACAPSMIKTSMLSSVDTAMTYTHAKDERKGDTEKQRKKREANEEEEERGNREGFK